MREIEEWERPYMAGVSVAAAVCIVTFFLVIDTTWWAYVLLFLAYICIHTGIGIIRGMLK